MSFSGWLIDGAEVPYISGLRKVLRKPAASLLASLALLLLACTAGAQTNVTTHHNDNSRTGQNLNETLLTPANVNSSTFGKLFSVPVDGYVYAQPLYVTNVTLGAGTSQPGTTHNIIYIATEHDSVYAFDADTNGGANGTPLWQVSFLDTAHGAAAGATTVPNGVLGTGDIVPEIGITGTPVIDLSTNTMYVVGKTAESSTYVQRLHALDIRTGAEKFGGPVTISAQVPGNGTGSSGGVLRWDPEWENNRPGLLLQNGIVYLGFAAHGDNGPWHGWVLAYNAATLAQTGAWCTSPNGTGSGIWMSGSGLAGDIPDPVNHPYGRLFFATGNGNYSATAPYDNTMNYGDSLVRLDLTNGVPSMANNGVVVGDQFTPSNQATLNNGDVDVASGGVLLLPNQSSGGHTRILLQVGKEGKVYVVDRDAMGGYSTTTDNVIQEVSGQTGGLWSMPAYWNGNVYFWGVARPIRAFSFSNGLLSTTPTSQGTLNSSFPGATPAISANGNTNGIVWAIQTDNYNSSGNAILRAFDATNVATLLYSSSDNSSRDQAGISTKFVVPTVVNGKVYVGAAREVDIYGLLTEASKTATPVFTPGSEDFTGSVTVTISDSTSGAVIYYTTDGSAPTVKSAVYSGGIVVSSDTTIRAIASATGYLQSDIASATYMVANEVATPVLSPAPGTFVGSTSVTITDAMSGAKIYYTLDGSMPIPGSGSTLLYSAPIPVSANTTIRAIGTLSGSPSSPIVTGTYTLATSGTGTDFANGFSNALSYMTFNGSTGLDDTRLQLTSGLTNQAGSAWYSYPVSVQSFSNDFLMQISNAGADGMTFTIQNSGLTALGAAGGQLGYGGIAKSIAIKFDIYNNSGEGTDSTGLYINGASPITPSVDMSASGVVLLSGNGVSVHMNYDGTTLTMTLSDPVVGKTFTYSWTIDIPGTIGSNTAYVGFTGGTGGLTASQKILTWTYGSSSAQPKVATPAFSPAGGVYLGTQSVTIGSATSGSSIFYTLDGTTPGTSAGGSTIAYTGPVTVTASETITAVATATGYLPSTVAGATYTIEAQAPAPAFSPAGGIYPAPQTVTITSVTPGSSIYYTTDGTTPTGSSALYTQPIAVNSNQTLSAIAVAPGYFTSNVTSAVYTINATAAGSLDLSGGFSTGVVKLNGNSKLNGTRLRITDGTANQAGSAWYALPLNIQKFTTSFNFQITGGTTPTADGFAFVIQGGPNSAIGPGGGGLGYGPDNPTNPAASNNAPIGKSIAVKFDLYSNAKEGVDSTGLYTAGASPTIPAVDMTSSGVNLHLTNVINAQLEYDGVNLTLILTDSVTAATFTNTWQIDIPGAVGGNVAFVGFTGGTGGNTAIQEIINWTLTSNPGSAAIPTFNPPGGNYSSPQTVSISDTTPSAVIHYTIDGTAPTSASKIYAGAVSVSSSQTIQAIAIANGYLPSGTGSASYTITQAAATPTFTPPAGTYTSVQSVSISTTTAGATLYYTTDGSTPMTSSTVYSGPINVGATQTIRAIAVAAGYSQSAVGSAAYVINLPVTINYSNGFAAAGLALNGSAQVSSSRLRLTDGGANEAASAWYTTMVSTQVFTSDFKFQLTNPKGNGFTFVLQGTGTTALGPSGGGLGYGPDKPTNPSKSSNSPIAKSVAIKFDLVNNAGEGTNSTGIYLNGASPTIPATTLVNRVDLHSGDIFSVHLTYDGTTLSMTITDQTNPIWTMTTSWPVNIPSAVGGNMAYAGFTAGTGANSATQEILSWSYNPSFSSRPPVIYQTSTLPAVSSGPTFRTFTYSGFPDTTGTILDAKKAGDNVAFTLNVATAGTYDVKLSVKEFNSRGISQLSINGTTVGPLLDQYSPTELYAVFDFGSYNFSTAGTYTLTFTVTGKNSSSSGYGISFDDIILTPQ